MYRRQRLYRRTPKTTLTNYNFIIMKTLHTNENVGRVPYSAPDCTIVNVKVQGFFCQSPGAYHSGGAGTYNPGEINNNGDY